MHVTSIEFGSPTADHTIPSPNWETIETHLRALDGNTTDGVILTSSGNSYIGISGGRANQYIVAGYINGVGSVILASGKRGGDSQQVVVNGDFNTYPSQYVVGLDDVIVAAKLFFHTGGLAHVLNWERQM